MRGARALPDKASAVAFWKNRLKCSAVGIAEDGDGRNARSERRWWMLQWLCDARVEA